MYKKIILLVCFCLGCYYVGISQNEQGTVFTLNDCIEIAIKNNLQLKTKELKAKTSEVNYKQSKNNILPTFNMNYNVGVNNGRNIDPFTNNFVNQGLTFSNAGLALDVAIFNGFKIKNEIKQSKFNMLTSEMEIEETKQNLTIEVTLIYIQILNNKDLLKLSKSKLNTTQSQLKRLKIHYTNGVGNLVDFTDMQGQYAIDQIDIINAENNLKLAIINLFKILNLTVDSKKSFENILGLIETEKYQFSADEVYNDALQNLATFKSKQLKINAAKKGIKVAKSNYFPELSLFGQLNTNYSSAANSFIEAGANIVETGDFININNQVHSVLRNETTFLRSKINYKSQFENNLNSVIGLSLRIPLFNAFRGENLVVLQKIKYEETLIELQQTKLNFKQSIQEVYNNMESAFKRYSILLRQVDAFEESFRVNEVRFNNGVSNIVDYITSKNNMDSSRLNLNKAKYEYLLQVKILEYYRGI